MDDENLPVYALRFSAYGNRSFNDAVVYTDDASGKDGADAENYARAFRRGLFAEIGTLATMPTRNPVAPEASRLAAPSVRVLPYRQNPGSPVWRILYRIHEADENDPAYIEIVTIRHGAQKPMTRAEGRDIDSANRANR